MFGLSFGEVLIILVVALLVLGPSGMPKLARTLGKGLRDFRRATGELRGAFEDEFYQLDKQISQPATKPATKPGESAAPQGAVAVTAAGAVAGAAEGVLAVAPEGAVAGAAEGVLAVAPEGAVAVAPEGAVAVAPEGAAAAETTTAAESPLDARVANAAPSSTSGSEG